MRNGAQLLFAFLAVLLFGCAHAHPNRYRYGMCKGFIDGFNRCDKKIRLEKGSEGLFVQLPRESRPSRKYPAAGSSKAAGSLSGRFLTAMAM